MDAIISESTRDRLRHNDLWSDDGVRLLAAIEAAEAEMRQLRDERASRAAAEAERTEMGAELRRALWLVAPDIAKVSVELRPDAATEEPVKFARLVASAAHDLVGKVWRAATGDTHEGPASVEALLAAVSRLRAIIEGRTTPPTDEEIAAHAATGGRWAVSTRDGSADLVTLPRAVHLLRDERAPRYAPKRWVALDTDCRPCDVAHRRGVAMTRVCTLATSHAIVWSQPATPQPRTESLESAPTTHEIDVSDLISHCESAIYIGTVADVVGMIVDPENLIALLGAMGSVSRLGSPDRDPMAPMPVRLGAHRLGLVLDDGHARGALAPCVTRDDADAYAIPAKEIR